MEYTEEDFGKIFIQRIKETFREQVLLLKRAAGCAEGS